MKILIKKDTDKLFDKWKRQYVFLDANPRTSF